MASLKNSVEDDDWVNMIQLHFKTPSYHEKKLVIVEGKTDISLFRRALPENKLHYDSPCSGKEGVLKSVAKLKSRGMRNIIGICDADFDHLLGKYYDNVFLTDYHDIEIMMLTDDFFSSFFYEYTDHKHYSSEKAESIYNDLKNSIFSICYKIGILKYINYEKKLGLLFAGMKYSCFVKIQGFNISFDLECYIDHILCRSPDCSLTKQEVREIYDSYFELDKDKLHICNGHDFTYVLGMIYKEAHTQDRNISQEKVERVLRMSYQSDIFTKTNLAKSIINSI